MSVFSVDRSKVSVKAIRTCMEKRENGLPCFGAAQVRVTIFGHSHWTCRTCAKKQQRIWDDALAGFPNAEAAA